MASKLGFTLFEVIIALLLIGIVAAVTAPALFRALGASDPGVIAGELASVLRRTRSLAIAENDERFIAFDARSGGYSVDGAAARMLPSDLNLAVSAAASEHVAGGIKRIRFFADGTSTGGDILLANDRSRHLITVDWLTGQIRVDDAADPAR